MVRILIIEKDEKLNNQLAKALRDHGCDVSQCNEGDNGVNRALAEIFDLILLDILLPSIYNQSLIQRIRRGKQTPIMVLSPSNSTKNRIEIFQQGADDYLPKPLNLTEVVLRVNALLRRMRGVGSMSEKVIYIDQLALHKADQLVLFSDKNLTLTPIEFRLFWVLVKNRHQILNKQDLYHAVLERKFYQYDRTLDMHLSRIRKKLNDVGMASNRLTTVHGKGYRFS